MDYIIETNFQGSGFVAVPNHVAQNAALSPEALGVLVYFGSLPRGYLMRVASVLERFAMGKDRWQRIARELRDAGAMTTEIVRGAGGRAVGRRVSVRWPDPVENTESRKIPLSDRKPEKPAAGKPAKVSRKIRQSEPEKPAPYKEERKKKGGGARIAAVPPARSPVARPMVGGSGGSAAAERETVSGRPADPWQRAAIAASLGLQWVHPESGLAYAASDFPKGAEKSGAAHADP